jgi:hypothetical protein
MATIRWEAIIDEKGEVVTNVLEREDGVQCATVKQITDAVGDELNDERTGPECDKVEEIQI